MPSGIVQASLGAGALLLGAAVTGIVPVANLLPQVQRSTPPVVIHHPVQPTPSLRTSGQAATHGVSLQASLGHGQLVRGSDGALYLHCSVSVDDAKGKAPRQPVDLALVLDTSGSMIGNMDLLKRATLGVAERLQAGDRLTLVTYSTAADLIFQGNPVGAEAQLDAAVGALVASGGTNISDGVMTAAEALGVPAPGRARRILLMTDGLANQGITEPRGLSNLIQGLRGQGIAVSSMGLGDSYDERLLGTLADVGGGAYHYVDRPEGLAQVYAAEIDALRGLAATGARLQIQPAAGTVVEEVYSWSNHSVTDGVREVALGDLTYGRSLKVVARLRVPTGAANVADAANVRLSFRHHESQSSRALAVGTLSVGLTDDPQAFVASENVEVKSDLRQAQVSEQLQRAHAAAQAGRKAEAKRVVLELERTMGEGIEFAAPSGEVRSLRFRELAEDMAGEGESARRALKMSDAAARAAGR